jgi:tripartite-type tricarboxylate transporter receptor subunit TctC
MTIARGFLRLAATVIVLNALLQIAAAQDYPSHPVRLIVPAAPGGPSDIMGRIIAQKLSEAWGQQFVVENLPTGAGNVAVGMVAKSPPDGYTILTPTSAVIVNPSLYARLPYDTVRDFAAVTNAAASPHVLTVNPAVPAKTVQDLVALVRANPGKYSFASSGANTQPRLVGELFKLKFGLDLVHVPFNGGGPAMTSTIGGHTPIAFTSLGNAAPSIKDGKLRALALTSAQRLAEFPNVPTMAEAGLPQLVTGSMQGVVLPARTPKPIVDRWHTDVAKIVARPEIRDRLIGLGLEPVANTPQEFEAWIKAEIEKWGEAMQAAKVDRI